MYSVLTLHMCCQNWECHNFLAAASKLVLTRTHNCLLVAILYCSLVPVRAPIDCIFKRVMEHPYAADILMYANADIMFLNVPYKVPYKIVEHMQQEDPESQSNVEDYSDFLAIGRRCDVKQDKTQVCFLFPWPCLLLLLSLSNNFCMLLLLHCS